MLKSSSFGWILLLFCLAGCGGAAYSQRNSKLHYADRLNVFFSPQLITSSVSLVQQVVFQKGADKFDFTVMVDANKEKIVMAGLSPLGKRQFLMTATATQFNYEAEMLFELPFPPQYLVRDFLLVFGNAQALERQIENVKLNERELERMFSIEKDIIRISYSSASNIDRFSHGDVVVEHLKEGYTLRVSTAQVERHGKE